MFLIGGFVLRNTVFGRHAYAVGVNRGGGLPLWHQDSRHSVLLYVATGIAAGLGGIITAARIDAAPGGTIANGFELSVLTAVLSVASPSAAARVAVFGILLGVAFMAILRTGLTLMNVSNTMQMIAQGLCWLPQPL